MFSLYFSLGIEHIADFQGYDHILFLIAICMVYLLRDIKKVLILVTAFTIGHSVTLALAALGHLKFSTEWIEFLIPVTILLSAVFVLSDPSEGKSKRHHMIKYFSALFFGLIHGLGFSNYLRAILGAEQDIVLPLFAFNIGLEIGQILIVFCYLLIAGLIINTIGVNRRSYLLVLGGAIAGISFIMALERLPF
jgi:hypothetical protein